MRFESPCILPFIDKFEAANPDILIIEIKLLIRISRMPDINPLPDIRGGNFIYISFEADGGIIVDHPFMPDQKNFIQFRFCGPNDLCMVAGPMIPVDGAFIDAGMQFVVIIIIQPGGERRVEFFQCQFFGDRG